MIFEKSLDKAIEGMAYQAEFRSYPSSDNISVVALQWLSSELQDSEGIEKENEKTEDADKVSQTLDDLDKALGNS
jgi:hypothetical protein